ncbi:F-box protein CPR1-like [Lotus japonicus]|uniref:F-box protein CPR1-like n=1 Tax=Lotus japonicus TaxID=34305 RepID=UPI00258F0DF8|nr:F-box protein CPR1-like [Lotus japonicus]
MNNQRPRRTIESPNLSSILPHDLIVQILLRLPVRSLLRFKSVCKPWLSLISDPQFGKSHYDLAAAPTHRCLAKCNDSEVESLDIDASLQNYESSVVNLKYPLSSPHHENKPVDFLGSCRGFILVANRGGNIIVWNPSTSVQRRIVDNLGWKKFQFLNGFGYDPSTDDYLLVRIEVIFWDDYIYSQQDPNIIANHPTRIRLFSMKTNSGLYLEGTYAQYVNLCYCEFRVGSFLNEALHWLVTSVETSNHAIIAFDLVEGSLSEIPLSQILARELEGREYHLRFMGECFSLCCPGDQSGVASMAEIWMMKNYKVRSSWTKLFAFSTCNIPRNMFCPICFTKHGEIFGSNGSTSLMIVNDEGKLLDECTFDTYTEDLLHCGMYRESLLSLPKELEETSEDGPADEFLRGDK